MAILGELLCIVMVFEDARHPQSSNLSKSDQELFEPLMICVYMSVIDQVANCLFIPPEKLKFRPIFCTISGLRRPQKSNFWTRFGSILGTETGSIFGTKRKDPLPGPGQIWFHFWNLVSVSFGPKSVSFLGPDESQHWAWPGLAPFWDCDFHMFGEALGERVLFYR